MAGHHAGPFHILIEQLGAAAGCVAVRQAVEPVPAQAEALGCPVSVIGSSRSGPGDQRLRTTTTGHSAWFTTCKLTEPVNIPVNAP